MQNHSHSRMYPVRLALLVACLALLAPISPACTPPQLKCTQGATASGPGSKPSPRGCTVVTVSRGQRVFFGGNDDYVNRDSYYWVDPGGIATYGAIWFGQPDNVQQGFNEVGLAYDANGLPKAPVNAHPGSKPVYGGYSSYPIQILRACATVAEVIAWVQEHQWHTVMHDQLHFADATGDAVVISAGPDGKVAFTRKPPGDGHLVSTNFNVANPDNGSYPCWRHSRAEELLAQIESKDELSVERVAPVMEAVHVERPTTWTLYSVVADLTQRLIYVYYMFQYDAPLVLDIGKEIDRAPAGKPLSALFPPETVHRADQAYERLMARTTSCSTAAYVWLGLAVVSLAALLLLRPRRRALLILVPVASVLGPLGLLVARIATPGRRQGSKTTRSGSDGGNKPRTWQRALLEAGADLPPYVVGVVVALLVIAFVPQAGQSDLLQILLLYALPLLLGLLLYQAPLLAWATEGGYAHTVWRRLPAFLVSANLALAGILAVTLTLLNWLLNDCAFSAWTIVSLWAITVLGALAGGLLLAIYQAWAVRRGLAAWSAMMWDTQETAAGPPPASYPTWRHLWPWILLSSAVLSSGVLLGLIGFSLTGGA